jgi:acetyl esterase/lipase
VSGAAADVCRRPSAGGHLAALAGLADGAIAAVVAWYPLTDLSVLDPHDPETPMAKLIGGPRPNCPRSRRRPATGHPTDQPP